jgi:3-hydroxyisobutyrate dehydrogenase-like beta-hydroxyacid dehydrogenase
MAPANCAEGTGWMLISGDPARHQALQPALKAMTGSVVYLGLQPERGRLALRANGPHSPLRAQPLRAL